MSKNMEFVGILEEKEKILVELENLERQVGSIEYGKSDDILKDIEHLRIQILEAKDKTEVDDVLKKIEIVKEKILEQTKGQLLELKKSVLKKKKNYNLKNESFSKEAERGRQVACKNVEDTLKKAVNWYGKIPYCGRIIVKFLKAVLLNKDEKRDRI